MVSAFDLFLYGSYSAPALLKNFYIFQAIVLLLPPEHYFFTVVLKGSAPCSSGFLKLTRIILLKDYSRSLSKPIPSEEQEKGPRKGSGTLRSSPKIYLTILPIIHTIVSPTVSPIYT